MSDIDLKAVAVAIRNGRFEDISQETWDKVADKIESLAPKKRGRKNLKGFSPLQRYNAWVEMMAKAKTTGVFPAEERFEEICECLDRLLAQGLKKGQAYERAAKELGISRKSIERILSGERASFELTREMIDAALSEDQRKNEEAKKAEFKIKP